MVSRKATSLRRGIRGAENPVGRRQRQRIKHDYVVAAAKRKNNRVRVFGPAEKKNRAASFLRFKRSLSITDKQETHAVRECQKKIKDKCIHPPGRNLLVRTLSKSDKAKKPTIMGQPCICVPPSSPSGNILAAWMAAFFVSFYYPNKAKCTLVILRRTELAMSVNKKLKPFFVVQAFDCFSVPGSFTPEWRLNFEPTSGVYAIQASNKDVYVGESKDIAKRLHFHNAGKGAMFTMGRKWVRICTIVKVRDSSSQQSLESQEMKAHEARLGPDKVAGAYKTATARKKK